MVGWLERYVHQTLEKRLGTCRKWVRRINALGAWNCLALVIRSRCGTRGATYRLNARHAKYPLYFRLGSSDLKVFDQIFVDLEYGPLCDLRDVRLVIDCGANVGYSSAFLLSQFPSCHIVAVEPDAGNFSMLERNLREYGSRAEVVHAGIWSCSVPLKVSEDLYRDGREWSVQVRPCDADEVADIEGVSIESLLNASRFSRISLLKIDIEGAEAVVFKDNVEWLDRVDAIAIELHDDSGFGRATEVFHAAIRDRGFDVSRSGELTICRRRAEQSNAAYA